LNNLNVNSKQDEFACDKCSEKFPSTAKLTGHKRTVHESQKTTQTEEKLVEDKLVQYTIKRGDKSVQTCVEFSPAFIKYPCYYCVKYIASESDLNDHRNKCQGVVLNFSSDKTKSDQYRTDSNKVAVENSAINVYHGLLQALISQR
jgi:hypothetical protein